MADKLAMLLVLRKQADDAKKSRASIRATTPMNELKRAFAELKRVFSPCYVIYLEEVQRQANVKHRTPLLNYQNSGKRLQDLFPFAFAKKDCAACPSPRCGHKSTMECGSHSVANNTLFSSFTSFRWEV